MSTAASPRLSSRPARRARAFARGLGLAVAALGAIVLVGRAFDIPALTVLGPGPISIKANTAVCLLSLGLAVRWSHAGSRRLRRVTPVLALLSAAVGALTLSEHLFGWNLGIDQLLFTEPPGEAATSSPGRMGPPAATSFVLLGGALALRRLLPRRPGTAEALALGAGLVALNSIVGYAYGAHALFGIAGFTGIAFTTAVAIEALAVATLATARRGPLLGAIGKDTPGARLARRSLVGAVAIPLVAGWLVAQGLRARLYDGGFAIAAVVLVVVLTLALMAARDVLRLDRAEDDRVRAVEALRESDRRKGEFLGVLSHELRNPLAAIRSAIHVLQRAPAESPPHRNAVAVLERQTAHLVRLVEDLLDVTRISRGKIQLRRTTVDAAAIAERTCDDHRALFERSGVSLSWNGPDRPVWVLADETRLAQIVGNLLQNAAKFTPSGGAASLSVAVEGESAVVRVRDSGIGLPGGHLDHIFEPFAQVTPGAARAHGGLGLGLAIVKQLVELHAGTVRVRSDGAGRGAEFEVRLPLVSAPAAAQGSVPA